MIQLPFAYLAPQGPAPFPPTGSYVTANLAYYYDFGETSSYPGVGSDIVNIAPSATKRGDAQIWSGTLDLGSKTNALAPFNAVKRTLQPTGTGGVFDTYTTDASWFGDITNSPSLAWPSVITAEFGYYYQPQIWTGQGDIPAVLTQRNAGPGTKISSFEGVIYTQLGYFLPNGKLTTTPGQAYITTMVWDSTVIRRYINGVFEDSVATISNRTSASSAPMAWAISYTKETANDRLGGPSNSEFQYVRWYEGKALTAAEVLQNYNANKGRLGLT
tara:strand:- start:203 stop:1021 length:819 start_codon:yes stop_codon:yes gene_type:complete